MLGFDSIETARKYFYLFEWTDRFPPSPKTTGPWKGENWTSAANALLSPHLTRAVAGLAVWNPHRTCPKCI